MKHLLFSAAFALSFTTLSLALPKPEQLPGNLIGLRVLDISNSSFGAKMKAKGVDFEELFAMLPDDAQMQWKTNEALRTISKIKSAAIGFTADSKTNLPNGLVVYADGCFDAPALVQKLIDLPDVQARLSQEQATNNDVILSIGQAPLGKAFTVSINRSRIPEPLRTSFPALSNGVTLTLEAAAPNMLRLSSAGALPGKGRPALAPTDAFAKMLQPADGFFFRDKITVSESLVSNLIAFQMSQASKAEQEQMKKIFELPIFKAFFSNPSYEAELAERGNNICYTLTFNTTSPEVAEELQEAMIGYKVLMRTMIDVIAAQLAGDPNMPAWYMAFVKAGQSTIASIKVTVSDDNRVCITALLTVDQCADMLKAALAMGKDLRAAMAASNDEEPIEAGE